MRSCECRAVFIVVTDRVAWSVSLSVTVVSPAKTTEPIDLPLGLWTRVGRKKHKFHPIRQVVRMCPHGRRQITLTTCFQLVACDGVSWLGLPSSISSSSSSSSSSVEIF